MGFELNPRISAGSDATFVNVVFLGAWFGRLKKAKPQTRDGEGGERKRDGHNEEQGEERIGMVVHWVTAVILPKAAGLGSMFLGVSCAFLVLERKPEGSAGADSRGALCDIGGCSMQSQD